MPSRLSRLPPQDEQTGQFLVGSRESRRLLGPALCSCTALQEEHYDLLDTADTIRRLLVRGKATATVCSDLNQVSVYLRLLPDREAQAAARVYRAEQYRLAQEVLDSYHTSAYTDKQRPHKVSWGRLVEEKTL